MPLKVTVKITVSDGSYSEPITVEQARSVEVQPDLYDDPQPKGYLQAQDTLAILTERAQADATEALHKMHAMDVERVDAKRAERA